MAVYREYRCVGYCTKFAPKPHQHSTRFCSANWNFPSLVFIWYFFKKFIKNFIKRYVVCYNIKKYKLQVK